MHAEITGRLTDSVGAVVTVTRRGDNAMLYVTDPDAPEDRDTTEVDLHGSAAEFAAVLREHLSRCHEQTLEHTETEDAGGVRLLVGSGFGSVNVGYGEPPLYGEHHPLIDLRAEGCAELIRLLDDGPEGASR